jgi:hypothetical protein
MLAPLDKCGDFITSELADGPTGERFTFSELICNGDFTLFVDDGCRRKNVKACLD